MNRHGEILVVGATGTQGGAVMSALLGQGFTVRALTRDAGSARARAVAGLGARLVEGDFDDATSLATAAGGCLGVFSMQRPPRPDDADSELRAGRNLVAAARQAGVEIFVHSSVARAGDQQSFAGWREGRWRENYWNSKSGVNDMVRSARFPRWTILKPAFMMENFIPPKAGYMFPTLARGVIATAYQPATRLDLIAAGDIGRFAAAAFADPERFDRAEIDLASEALTMSEVAGIISAATRKTVTARYLPAPDAVLAGQDTGLVNSQEWSNVEGYKVDIAGALGWGIPLTAFADWASDHARRFVVSATE